MSSDNISVLFHEKRTVYCTLLWSATFYIASIKHQYCPTSSTLMIPNIQTGLGEQCRPTSDGVVTIQSAPFQGRETRDQWWILGGSYLENSVSSTIVFAVLWYSEWFVVTTTPFNQQTYSFGLKSLAVFIKCCTNFKQVPILEFTMAQIKAVNSFYKLFSRGLKHLLLTKVMSTMATVAIYSKSYL